jgi:hypothetical protein
MQYALHDDHDGPESTTSEQAIELLTMHDFARNRLHARAVSILVVTALERFCTAVIRLGAVGDAGHSRNEICIRLDRDGCRIGRHP